MNRTSFRRFALGMIAAPLAMALAACGGGDGGATASGDPIAAIAPPAGQSWTETVEKTPQGGYRMGNPDAPIKLVEFASLTCPACAAFSEASSAELRDDFVASGRVSFELRNFVRDAIDITAAQLTRCGAPESYFALTEQAFANQEAMFQNMQKGGEPAFNQAMNAPENQRGMAIAELAGLVDFFAARGISREQAATCLADVKATEALAQQTQDQGKELNITGTPSFMINGERVDVTNWPDMKARLEAMGAR